MTRLRRLLPVLMLPIVIGGCQSADPAPAAKATASTSTSTPKASSSAPVGGSTGSSTSSAASPSTKPAKTPDEAAAAARATLLPTSVTGPLGFKVTSGPTVDQSGWFWACNQALGSDKAIIKAASVRWSAGNSTYVQSSAVYPPGAGLTAVSEAKGALGCGEYLVNGAKHDQVSAFTVPDLAVADQTGWCERIKTTYLCGSIFTNGEIVTQVWVLSDTLSSAQAKTKLIGKGAAGQLPRG